MHYNFGQTHLKRKVCCCYKFLIAAGGGGINFRSTLRHLQNGGCFFLSNAVIYIYIYTGMFHTQGAWVHIAQSCWEPKQDEASSFPKKKKKKKKMPKKKQMKGTIQGAKCEMSSKNQTQAQLEVITLQGCRKKGDGNKNPPPPPRQCLRKCWLQQRVGDKTYRKHQELLLFL